MLRLGSSHIQLTNGDTSRSLRPSRGGRQATSLRTTGKKPTRASARLAARAAAAAASTARRMADPDIYFGQGDRILPSPVSPAVDQSDRDGQDAQDDPGPADWSVAPDLDEALAALSLPAEPEDAEAPITAVAANAAMMELAFGTGTTNASGADGAAEPSSDSFEEFRNARQVISLATVDSFPYLPIPTQGNFPIWEDSEDTVVEDPASAAFDELSTTDVDDDSQSWDEEYYSDTYADSADARDLAGESDDDEDEQSDSEADDNSAPAGGSQVVNEDHLWWFERSDFGPDHPHARLFWNLVAGFTARGVTAPAPQTGGEAGNDNGEGDGEEGENEDAGVLTETVLNPNTPAPANP
ncbi:hypothetical protein TWF696_007043 [Orbilia brochopaga]|uniref:Uncharacterized protein n=1 Tax=Orbilia brochopaga TaxID=3140254 RepID=A0AAV9UQP1_9PEZI